MSIYVEDRGRARAGYIEDNRVEDRNRAVAGYINGDRIEDRGRAVAGYAVGSRIEDRNRSVVGYINGDRIEDSGRAVAGYINGPASDSQKAAAGLLLLGLSYGSPGGSGESSGGSGESLKDGASGNGGLHSASSGGGYDPERRREEINRMVMDSMEWRRQWEAAYESAIEARVRQLKRQLGPDYPYEELRVIAEHDKNIAELKGIFDGLDTGSDDDIIARLAEYEKEWADEEKRGLRLRAREKRATALGGVVWVGMVIAGIACGHWFLGVIAAVSLIGVFVLYAQINQRGARGIIAAVLTTAAFVSAIGLFAYGVQTRRNDMVKVAGIGILASGLVFLLPALWIGTGTPAMDEKQTHLTADVMRKSKERVAKIHAAHAGAEAPGN